MYKQVQTDGHSLILQVQFSHHQSAEKPERARWYQVRRKLTFDLCRNQTNDLRWFSSHWPVPNAAVPSTLSIDSCATSARACRMPEKNFVATKKKENSVQAP